MVGCLLAAASQVSFPQTLGDVRAARVTLDEKRAVKIAAVVGHPVVVELEPGERIEDIVQSEPDADGWEVAPKGHRLVLMPLKGAKPRSFTAIARNRTYLFEALPLPPTPDNLAKRLARVSIEIPAPPKAVVVAAAAAEPPAPLAATEPQSAPRAAQRRNASYSLQMVSESVDIRPREVFDDGRFTYFRFPTNVEVPAIYKSVPDAKEEWLVNFHREGDFVVMQAVSPLWTLRLGGSVLGVFNDAYSAEGLATRDGTTTHALKRELRK